MDGKRFDQAAVEAACVENGGVGEWLWAKKTSTLEVVVFKRTDDHWCGRGVQKIKTELNCLIVRSALRAKFDSEKLSKAIKQTVISSVARAIFMQLSIA